MAFTVEEFRDLVQLLEQRPEWRAELRRLVLTGELLELPTVVRELAQAQERTEARLGELAQAQERTEARLTALAQAQERTEARLSELAQAQERTEARLSALTQALERLTDQVSSLAHTVSNLVRTVDRLDNQVGHLRGDMLEIRYRNHVGAYFGRLATRSRLVSDPELTTLVDDARDAGIIGDGERDDILLADLVLRGRRRADGQDVYLVVEISAGIGPGDVRRAADRATFLSKIHLAEPVVAGEQITPAAAELAGARGVKTLVSPRTSEPAEQ